MEIVEREFRESNGVGPCSNCGGIVKLATISFGQMMPEEPMRRAEREALACDLFLVLGSSLTVYPAAAFPEVARQNGAKLIIVNQQTTEMDSSADLVIHAGIGETMEGALAWRVDAGGEKSGKFMATCIFNENEGATTMTFELISDKIPSIFLKALITLVAKFFRFQSRKYEIQIIKAIEQCV